jgi:mono/diheme cytochrome c family protein
VIPIRAIFFRVSFALLSAGCAIGASIPVPQTPPHPLVWDAMEKSVDVKSSDEAVRFEFSVTNQSTERVEIVEIRPSCGCTVAEMPSTPWILQPGANGSFAAVVDIKGKRGKLSKSLFINSTAGTQTLGMAINIIESEDDRRKTNQQRAFADRQAVFRGDCATCHVAPAVGKTGEALFQSACAVCHLATPRATMVPDLMVVREPRDAAFWEKWISEGKERTLMPAFAQKHGGPLTDEQIASLVEYAMKRLPVEPQKN